MSTFGRSRRRQGRRWLWRFVRMAIVLGGIVLSLGAAYEAGRSQSDTEAARMVEELRRERDRNGQLEARLAYAEQHLVEAGRAAAAQSSQPAAAALAQGAPTADLVGLVRRKLADGVEPARLGAAIAGVTRDRRCDPAAETHTIILRTPVSRDATSASFAGGLFTISGQGVSVHDAAGLPEAWFDPAQPVTLEIRMRDGSSVGASGLLPLRHGIVLSSHHYGLTATAGKRRGLLDLSVEACAYP